MADELEAEFGAKTELIEGRGPGDDRPGGIVTALVEVPAVAEQESLEAVSAWKALLE